MKKQLLLLLCLLFGIITQAVCSEANPDVDSQLEKTIHIDPSKRQTVGWITIGGHDQEINQSTWLYVKNALEYYKKASPISSSWT